MQEHEPSESPNPQDPEDAPEVEGGDAQLDGFESDLDGVAAALDALDADDLDRAEALAAGLDSSAAVDGESQG